MLNCMYMYTCFTNATLMYIDTVFDSGHKKDKIEKLSITLPVLFQ